MVELVLTAVVCAAILAAAVAHRRIARDRIRIAALEAALETQQDATWSAEERIEAVRREGERAMADAEARAITGDRAKTMFLATVTHEMRTPLSGVIGTTELLLETALAPEQRAYAGAVKQSAEAMLSLVDEILDLSRIDADRLTLQNASFSVAELVEGVAELLAPRAQAKGLDLAVMLGDGVPDMLDGDAPRIRQVLLNLAGNAVKFTETGGVGLRVDIADGEIKFAVSDTGPGFPQDDSERLFGEFERGPDIGASGVGLGLAISRKLAHAMGGALSAEAEAGAGAIFTLSLPWQGSAAPTREPLAGRSVLVVSAGPFSGPWLSERIRLWGGGVALVGPETDLREAGRGCDVALIDRAAGPGAGGLAATAREGGAKRVLLLLSPAERRELLRLVADGFDGYLVKPVRAASLLDRLLDPVAEPETPSQSAAPMVFPNVGGLRVLLAEDDPVSALIALAHLRRMGCDATHFGDGVSAAAAFEDGLFDVALIDLRMPRLDGCGVARRIRAAEAGSTRKPALVIALSANATAQDRDEALRAGVDALIAKPLDHAELAALFARRRAA
ncbi:ATP-binding protein [Hansschlegelia quercus]|uniref:ATP-binding protein n=1 Tax=Hansschlegelia quercus TaxID=2528245 RepID=UPI0013EEF147|nr:ATP-binding protein [Hansschlegelia quercus]